MTETEAVLEEAERRIKAVLDVLIRHGQVESVNGKTWVIDQVLRAVAGGAYADVVKMIQNATGSVWDEGFEP